MTQIRRAITSDIPQIVHIWKEFVSNHQASFQFFARSPQNSEHYATFLQKKLMETSTLLLISEDINIVNGFIHIEIVNALQGYIKNEYGYIHELIVQESFQGKGIGKMLYKQSIQWLINRKITRVELDIATTNPNAWNFWHALGFKKQNNTYFSEI